MGLAAIYNPAMTVYNPEMNIYDPAMNVYFLSGIPHC
jgi:hypothetical protein